MAWVRFDDEFYDHPKVCALSPNLRDACITLFVFADCWSSKQLTDGFIPAPQIARLMGKPVAKHAKELVRVALWEDAEGGWQVHDYLEYNPSREESLQDRGYLHDVRSAAGKKGAASRWQGNKGTSKPIASAIANGYQTDGPVPVPVPLDIDRSLQDVAGESGEGSKTALELGTWSAEHVTGWEAGSEDVGLFSRLLLTWTETQVRDVLGAMAGQSGKKHIGSPRSYLESSLKRQYPPAPKTEPTVVDDPVVTDQEREESLRIIREARKLLPCPVPGDDFSGIDFGEEAVMA